MSKMGKKGFAKFQGFEKEPPQPHGPRERGNAAFHSHSATPRKKLAIGKRVSSKTSVK